MTESNETGTNPPAVISSLCVGCGSCEAVCQASPNVFEIQNDIAVVINPDACTDCDQCVIICPVDAIER